MPDHQIYSRPCINAHPGWKKHCPQMFMCLLQVRDSLTARAKEFNIMVDDIAITHLSFGTEVINTMSITFSIQNMPL